MPKEENNLPAEIVNEINPTIQKIQTPAGFVPLFSKSSNERVSELSTKLEKLINKGLDEQIAAKGNLSPHVLTNLTANYIKLIEINREIELTTSGGDKVYEIVAMAPDHLKAEFQEVWFKVLEHYAKVKGCSIDDIFKD